MFDQEMPSTSSSASPPSDEPELERRLSVSSTSSAATQTEETAPTTRPISMRVLVFLAHDKSQVGVVYDDFTLLRLHYKWDVRGGQFSPLPTLIFIS